MRRRELLASAAGLAGATVLGLPASAGAASSRNLSTGLENLLYGHGADAVRPVPLPGLRMATIRARELFQGARHDDLAAGLPALIATATATRDHMDGDARMRVDALLADAYTVAANFMTKLNDDQLAWATADRAVQTAAASGDALALADARRSVATVLRRTGRPANGQELLLAAAHDIEPGPNSSPEELSMYGALLQTAAYTAAYTAAVDGDRPAAAELIAEAEDLRGPARPRRQPPALGLLAPLMSPSSRSASPRSSATAEPRSSTPARCGRPPSRPANVRAATGSTSPAPTTNGASTKTAIARCAAPSAPPRPKSATGRRSIG